MKKCKTIEAPKIFLDKPDDPRSTALDPDLLTAEISLLLDHLSGLPERILTSPPHGHPPGCETYNDALSRYFVIDEKVRRGEALASPDLFCSICVTILIAGLSLLPALLLRSLR